MFIALVRPGSYLFHVGLVSGPTRPPSLSMVPTLCGRAGRVPVLEHNVLDATCKVCAKRLRSIQPAERPEQKAYRVYAQLEE